MKQIIIFITVFIISLFLLGCSQPKEPKEVKINLIVIDFYPAFIVSSTAILDLSNNQVFFKRFGSKTYFRIMKTKMPNPKVQNISTLSFKPDMDSYTCLKDSIQFTEEDFIDREILAEWDT